MATIEAFPSLAEVRESVRIPWYRTKVDIEVLRELTRRSDLKGLAQALGHLLLFLATGALVFWLWYAKIWVGFAFALFFHGFIATHLGGTATHELGHGTVFRTKWLNTMFINIFSILSWWNHVDFKLSHRYHHLYTCHPIGDREIRLPEDPAAGIVGFLQLFTISLYNRGLETFVSGGFIGMVVHYFGRAFNLPPLKSAKHLEWLTALHRDDPQTARRSSWVARATLLFHGAVLAVAIVTGYWVLPLIFTTASFTANISGYLMGLTQHSGMNEDSTDFRKVARSMKLGPFYTFLYWRMNWHCEHHMYAAIPCYNLKKFARVIAWDLPEPLSLWGTWKEVIAVARIQRKDPSYEFERSLPPTATPYEQTSAGKTAS